MLTETARPFKSFDTEKYRKNYRKKVLSFSFHSVSYFTLYRISLCIVFHFVSYFTLYRISLCIVFHFVSYFTVFRICIDLFCYNFYFVEYKFALPYFADFSTYYVKFFDSCRLVSFFSHSAQSAFKQQLLSKAI